MTDWYLIVALAMTGQYAAVPVPSEELCNRYLADIRNGVPMTITTKDGVVLPIAKGLACQRETEEERSERDQARKAGV
jgi:hypothetical protein